VKPKKRLAPGSPEFEKLMTTKMAQKLHKRVSKLTHLKSVRAIAEKIKAEFPMYTLETLRDYVAVFHRIGENAFDHYLKGDFSFTVLGLLGKSELDPGTQDYLADEIVDKKLGANQVRSIKSMMRKGDPVTLAVKKELGLLPRHHRPGQKPIKAARNIETLVDDINKLSLELKVKIRMALELLPKTILDMSKVYGTIFEKAYQLRHIFHENHEFMDKVVKGFLDEMVEKSKAEDSRFKALNGGNNERKGKVEVIETESRVHETGQPVHPGEVRQPKGKGRQ
jgi:hypothetical protein